MMPKQRLAAMMAAVLIALTGLAPTSGQTPTTNELQSAEKVKSRIVKFGSGPKVRVIVELQGGETIKGYVSSIAPDSFVIEQKDGGGSREISYLQVKDIRKKPSAGRIIAIVGGVAGAGVGILYGTAYLLSKCGPCVGP